MAKEISFLLLLILTSKLTINHVQFMMNPAKGRFDAN